MSRSRSPRSRELDNAFEKGKQKGYDKGLSKGREEVSFAHGFFKGHYEGRNANNDNNGKGKTGNNKVRGQGTPPGAQHSAGNSRHDRRA